MIALVDYGLGNIKAFANIFRRLGYDVESVQAPSELRNANKIILPGVGAFDWAMTQLNQSGMRDTLDELVLEKRVQVLGVCVGMQMMASRSEEGGLPGLGWIDAEVIKFKADFFAAKMQLPHMGWNDVAPKDQDTLFAGLEAPRYYFLHSYYMVPINEENVLATATYGVSFAAAVRAGNVYGTQFHPEKSHHWGVSLLKNFAEL